LAEVKEFSTEKRQAPSPISPSPYVIFEILFFRLIGVALGRLTGKEPMDMMGNLRQSFGPGHRHGTGSADSDGLQIF
jgi:hypothetical protein